jgi:hypothetical protein
VAARSERNLIFKKFDFFLKERKKERTPMAARCVAIQRFRPEISVLSLLASFEKRKNPGGGVITAPAR